MATLTVHKVTALPETVTANAIYFIKEGSAFNIKMSSSDGAEVYPLASAGVGGGTNISFIDLTADPVDIYALNGTINHFRVLTGPAGEVSIPTAHIVNAGEIFNALVRDPITGETGTLTKFDYGETTATATCSLVNKNVVITIFGGTI